MEDKFAIKEPTLYIVATPIGNLADITERAREILANVDFVIAESRTLSSRLLAHLGIKKTIVIFDQHVQPGKDTSLALEIKSGKTAAYISDAGTPCISDPGSKLVSACVILKVKVVPIPGASAAPAIFSISGVASNKYVFLGFMPKRERVPFFSPFREIHIPIIFFDSPFRIEETLRFLVKFGWGDYYCLVGREMTKMYETFYRGRVSEVLDILSSAPKIKGEITVLVAHRSISPLDMPLTPNSGKINGVTEKGKVLSEHLYGRRFRRKKKR